MKKLIALIALAMVVFTLSSCATEEIEITIIVYSQNPEQTVSDLEDLPEIISNELSDLGYTHDRIVLQSSDQITVIEDGLRNGSVDIAIINEVEITSDSIEKVLSVMRDEVVHPDYEVDETTLQKAIVVSPSVNGEVLKIHIQSSTVHDFTLLNGMNVCTTEEDENSIDVFATYMGMTSEFESLLDVTPTTGTTEEVFGLLESESCDLGIVALEDFGTYASLWDDNDAAIYEALSVLFLYEPNPYGGLYTSEEIDGYLNAALVQAFIQLSAHNANADILEVLGHSSYYIPE